MHTTVIEKGRTWHEKLERLFSCHVDDEGDRLTLEYTDEETDGLVDTIEFLIAGGCIAGVFGHIREY